MELCERITLWRLAAGMNQRDLACAVGVSPAAVYQWEGTGNAKTAPSQRSLESIASVIGVSMADFYGTSL